MIGNDERKSTQEQRPELQRPAAGMHRPSEETQETNMGERQQAQCHIFTYDSPWKTYALGYSWRSDQPFRFALGSFLEGKANKVNSSHSSLGGDNTAVGGVEEFGEETGVRAPIPAHENPVDAGSRTGCVAS